MAVLGRSRSGAPPPDQILDPPLYIHVCFTIPIHMIRFDLAACVTTYMCVLVRYYNMKHLKM